MGSIPKISIAMNEGEFLFNMDEYPVMDAEKKFRPFDFPVWTQNKALFIARYLKAFTFVTKHGTYIDAFAGPQNHDTKDSSWAVKLVLENEPKRLRNFYLFDAKPEQINHLKALKENHLKSNPDQLGKRKIRITEGDCNERLPKFLIANPIRNREATFCLLDQRSTECNWETVKAVANHKNRPGVNKIELFYFLAQGWIDRAIKSWQNDVEERCIRWWGNSDVMDFLKLTSHERGAFLANRFKRELGYQFSYPFPIQKWGKSGAVMFWMVHASDHERAPDLMAQAYRHIGAGKGLNEPLNQFELEFGEQTGVESSTKL